MPLTRSRHRTRRRRALLDLCGREILGMRRDTPDEPGRIAQLAIAIAPELILQREHHLAAVGKRMRPRGVGVRDIQVQAQRPVAFRDGRPSHLRERVVEHHDGIVDLHVGVHELAARPGRAAGLDGVERAFQKLDVCGATRHGKVYRDRAEAGRNRMRSFCHCSAPHVRYRR